MINQWINYGASSAHFESEEKTFINPITFLNGAAIAISDVLGFDSYLINDWETPTLFLYEESDINLKGFKSQVKVHIRYNDWGTCAYMIMMIGY